ncbi:MAG: murein biosynthesis integral membrane protein MurJ, partial [Fervidobacterium sp.]
GLFGVAVATVILSTISNDRDHYELHLRKGLTSTMFFTVPASVGLIVLGRPILRLFYEYGQFTQKDTEMTAYVLSAYVIGLSFYGLYSTLARARHAVKDMKVPLKATTIVAFVNVILDLLVGLRYGPIGVSLATSVAGIVGFIYLLSKEKNKKLFVKDDFYIIISSLVMGISTYYFSTLSERRIWVIVSTIFGGLVYLVLSGLFFRERLKEFFTKSQASRLNK